MPDRTFDRLPSIDPRNAQYLAETRLRALTKPTEVRWRAPYVKLDQGPDGACVGFGWTNELMSLPVAVRPPGYDRVRFDDKLKVAYDFAMAAYHAAQLVDEYSDTPPAEGSSVNAGGKIMRSKGYITGWHWNQTVDDIIRALHKESNPTDAGPQVMGTVWTEGMFDPDSDGVIRATGGVAGGHCYLVRGYVPSWRGVGEVFIIRNSWGPWGFEGSGDAFIPVRGDEGMEGLMAQQGESAMPVGRVQYPAAA